MKRINALLKGSRWPITAILLSAAMLAVAHGFERIGGLLPCPLCLRQREVYWAIIAMTITGLLLWKFVPKRRFIVTLDIMIGLAFVVGAVVAGYHSGVEWGIIPAPAGCGSAIAVDPFNLDMLGQKVIVPVCDKAPFYFLGLSMAGWNVISSSILAIISFMAAAASFPRWRSDIPDA